MFPITAVLTNIKKLFKLIGLKNKQNQICISCKTILPK